MKLLYVTAINCNQSIKECYELLVMHEKIAPCFHIIKQKLHLVPGEHTRLM